MSDYKLSIVVPTFNLEEDIHMAFNSIKSQTMDFEDIEVIFVDDNSTDNTLKVINDYENEYCNVKVYKTDENSGYAGKPRNIGLEKTTSEYVLFLDGDDQLLVDACEVLLKNITQNNSDISIGAHINCYDNGLLEHIPPLNLGRSEVFKDTQDVNLFSITPAISAKLFKKEMLIKNNTEFPEGIPGQDLVFLIEAILNSSKVNVLNNQYIYFRNINRNSISFNITEKYLYGLTKAYTLIANLFEEHSIDFNIQEVIFKKHIGFFSTQILRAYHSEDFDNNKLLEILNSKSFDELSTKTVFKNNEEFDKYFEYLKDGKYRDAKNLISNLKLNINIHTNYLNLRNENINLKNDKVQLTRKNTELEDKNIKLTNHNTKLTEQNNTKNNEFVELKNEFDELEAKTNDLAKSNDYLTDENTNLKDELNEIKSSKLWKLKNIF